MASKLSDSETVRSDPDFSALVPHLQLTEADLCRAQRAPPTLAHNYQDYYFDASITTPTLGEILTVDSAYSWGTQTSSVAPHCQWRCRLLASDSHAKDVPVILEHRIVVTEPRQIRALVTIQSLRPQDAAPTYPCLVGYGTSANDVRYQRRPYNGPERSYYFDQTILRDKRNPSQPGQCNEHGNFSHRKHIDKHLPGFLPFTIQRQYKPGD